MDYQGAVERLYALGAELHAAPGQPRRKFCLDTMRRLMAALGNPQARFQSVLIAGTNGKGSTAATLACIVAAAGYRTGLYTSPHLIRVNERVQVLQSASREVVDDREFAALFSEVMDCAEALVRGCSLPHLPSFFEVVTAMAFLHFARCSIRLAVLEVGLGGRLDATNIVDPLLSIITDISLDHMEWLGSTISEIAREKAGILRSGGTMVTLPQHPEANQVLGEVATGLGVRGVNAAPFLPGMSIQSEDNRCVLYSDAGKIEVDSPLHGEHQRRNIALAIAAAMQLSNFYGYTIPIAALEQGLRATVWPGRLETIPGRGGRSDLLLDVAHNPAGAWSLRAALSALADRPLTLVFGCLRDKPADELAQILFPIFDRVILTHVDSPRAESLATLQAAADRVGAHAEQAPSVEAALQRAWSVTPQSGLVVATGSIFLVGKARELVLEAGQRVSA